MAKKNKKELMIAGAIHAFGIFAYIVAVSLFFANGKVIFKVADTFWAPVALLLLFVISAAVTGLLVFGRPARMYLQGDKEDAAILLFNTIISLVILLVLVFAIGSMQT